MIKKRIIRSAIRIVAVINYSIFIRNVKGIGNLPHSTGYIIAANHTSYLDVWALVIVIYHHIQKYIRFLAHKDLKKDPYILLLTSLFRTDEILPFYIGEKSLSKKMFSKIVTILTNKGIIGIFPEGERSADGKIKKGKTGAVRMAIASRTPIIPVGIKGAFELMPIERKFPKIRKNIAVNIGKPMYFDKYYYRILKKPILRRLTNNLMREITKLSGQDHK